MARIDTLYPGVMIKFGGHAMAAGMSVLADKIPDFEQHFDEVLREFAEGINWQQVIVSEGELADHEFTIEVAEQLRYATPWGK